MLYSEKVELKYPNNEEEFKALRRNDIDFDLSRVGKTGTPLRYPANPVELRISDVLSKSCMETIIEGSEDKKFILENLIQPQAKIPFMFRMPENEATFIEKNFPGDYNELVNKYEPGELVTEMEYYKKKTVYVLKAITGNDTCCLVAVNQDNSDHQDIIRVLFISFIFIEEHKGNNTVVGGRSMCI